MAGIAKVPFLGSVPMERAVRICGDTGEPIVISQPNSDAARALKSIAGQVAARVSIEALNENKKIPTINIV
jgi:ATP-binding protein involved in chromosome partitioning